MINECISTYMEMKIKPDYILTDFVVGICCGYYLLEEAREVCLKALQYEGAVDIDTLEYYTWGIIEENNLIYLEKKELLEPIYNRIKAINSVNCNSINNTNENSSSYNTTNPNVNIKSLILDLETFMFNSNYENKTHYKKNVEDKNEKYYERTNMYKNNMNSNNKNNYNNHNINNSYSNKSYSNNNTNNNYLEEKEVFNADINGLDFEDNKSEISFRSQFHLKPNTNYYNKKQSEYEKEQQKNRDNAKDIEDLFSTAPEKEVEFGSMEESTDKNIKDELFKDDYDVKSVRSGYNNSNGNGNKYNNNNNKRNINNYNNNNTNSNNYYNKNQNYNNQYNNNNNNNSNNSNQQNNSNNYTQYNNKNQYNNNSNNCNNNSSKKYTNNNNTYNKKTYNNNSNYKYVRSLYDM